MFERQQRVAVGHRHRLETFMMLRRGFEDPLANTIGADLAAGDPDVVLGVPAEQRPAPRDARSSSTP
jgi:hypothetical protein